MIESSRVESWEDLATSIEWKTEDILEELVKQNRDVEREEEGSN